MEKRDLLQLPVFQLRGGAKQERQRFAGQLAEVMESRSFRTILLGPGDCSSPQDLLGLLKTYDLVLAVEDLQQPVQQIVFDEKLQADPRPCYPAIFGSKGQVEKCSLELARRLNILVEKRPVWACVLIGGKSSRMGRPKHLIRSEKGKTWLENSIDLLRPLVDGVVIVGKGDVPDSLNDVPRLPDVPGVVGPLAGILSACRWQPLFSWLLLACDMPLINKDAVSWLLEERRAGDWGVVPILGTSERYEPLFAYYDYRAGALFEKQARNGNLRISRVAAEDKIFNPIVPEQLRQCWENVNNPEQLKDSLTKAP